MPLALVFDTLDAIPEAARGAYVEKDGKFHLDVEVEDTSALKGALQKERGSRGALEKKINAWEKLGKTPEEIAEMVAAADKAAEEAAREKGDFASILKQKQDAWEKEKSTLLAEVDVSRASERSAVVGERLLGALAKAGVTEEGSELLPDRLANRIKFETVNGKRVLKIMQADGETLMAGSGADGVATLDDLVKEAVTKYPSQFKANGGGGGGKPPETNGGKPNPTGGPATWSECKTDEQKAAFLKAKSAAKG